MQDNFSKNNTLKIKGIAILMMIWHHLFTYIDRIADVTYVSLFSRYPETVELLVGGFCKLCVSIFVFMAGYGLYLSSTDIKHQIKRIKNLYISYWRVMFVVLPISYLIGNIIYGWRNFILNLFGLRINYNGEWWFFTLYVILLLISPFIKWILEKSNNHCLLDIVVLMSMHLITKYYLQVEGFAEIYTYLPRFIMGMLFAKYGVFNTIKRLNINSWLSCSVGIIGMVALFYLRIPVWTEYDFELTFLLMIILCVFTSSKIKYVDPILTEFGNRSTTMWLTHSFFIYHWCKKLIFAPRLSILIFVWEIVITYVFSIGIDKLYEKTIKLIALFKNKVAVQTANKDF